MAGPFVAKKTVTHAAWSTVHVEDCSVGSGGGRYTIVIGRAARAVYDATGGTTTMGSDQSDKLDEVADGLDELKTTTEYLADNPPEHADLEKITKLGNAIEEARDIADDLEDDTK